MANGCSGCPGTGVDEYIHSFVWRRHVEWRKSRSQKGHVVINVFDSLRVVQSGTVRTKNRLWSQLSKMPDKEEQESQPVEVENDDEPDEW